MNYIYYVYQLRVEGEDLPFYVGKGKGKRAYHHLKQKTLIPIQGDHKNNKIKKTYREQKQILVEFLKENLCDDDSQMWEVFYIAEYGRSDLGFGPLVNKTNGADGGSGLIHSSSTKYKMHLSHIGKPKSHAHALNISIGLKEWNSIELNRKRRLEACRKACSSEEHSIKMKEVAIKRDCPELREKYRKTKLGDKNPMFGKRAWEHHLVTNNEKITLLWKNAEKFYDIYSIRGKALGFKNLKRILNIENVNHMNIAKYFKQGWNPYLDNEWKEWAND